MLVKRIWMNSKEIDKFLFISLIKLQKQGGGAGVREYWIVDSQKERVTVYLFEKETVEEYVFGEEAPVGIYEGFTITIE